MFQKNQEILQKPTMENYIPVGIGHIDKGLEEQLKEVYRRVMLNDTRRSLMTSLLNSGLCTRDIYSFVCAQVDLCTTLEVPDWTTVKCAMRNKIRDLTHTLKNDHELKNKLEKELLHQMKGKSWSLRKKIKETKQELQKEKHEMTKKYEQKIKHYKKCLIRLPGQERVNSNILKKQARVIPTIPPKNLEKYSTLSVFGPSENLPARKNPLGPFIVDKSIKLSKGEVALLSRNPKFSVKYPPSRMGMLTEVERMSAKVRYDKKEVHSKAKRPRITDADGIAIGCEGREEKKLEEMNLEEIFNKCKDRFIYNPLEKTINFSRRRATDYKLNRNVMLPGPLDNDKELECEIRRSSYMKAFDEYQEEEDIQGMNIFSGKKRLRSRVHTDLKTGQKFNKFIDTDKTDSLMGQKKKRGLMKEKQWTKKKKMRDPINLKASEIKAMKNLKEKIKEGQIIVSQTDKSSRFAVLSRKQYMESGMVHTSKDKKISWKEVSYIQAQVNSHVWWLTHILRYGEETDPGRVLKNLQNHSIEVPEMVLLIKDHKQWSPSSNHAGFTLNPLNRMLNRKHVFFSFSVSF